MGRGQLLSTYRGWQIRGAGRKQVRAFKPSRETITATTQTAARGSIDLIEGPPSPPSTTGDMHDPANRDAWYEREAEAERDWNRR